MTFRIHLTNDDPGLDRDRLIEFAHRVVQALSPASSRQFTLVGEWTAAETFDAERMSVAQVVEVADRLGLPTDRIDFAAFTDPTLYVRYDSGTLRAAATCRDTMRRLEEEYLAAGGRPAGLRYWADVPLEARGERHG